MRCRKGRGRHGARAWRVDEEAPAAMAASPSSSAIVVASHSPLLALVKSSDDVVVDLGVAPIGVALRPDILLFLFFVRYLRVEHVAERVQVGSHCVRC